MLDATNVMTYEPVVKSEYQTANAAKTATVTIAKGQSFNIGDINNIQLQVMDKLFQMAHLQILHLIETIPTAQEVM